MYVEKKVCLKKYLLKKKKFFFHKNIIKKLKYHQFISKTQPALNDPLRLICCKTKQKQTKNLNVIMISVALLRQKRKIVVYY